MKEMESLQLGKQTAKAKIIKQECLKYGNLKCKC